MAIDRNCQYGRKQERSVLPSARLSEQGGDARRYRSFVTEPSIRDDRHRFCQIDQVPIEQQAVPSHPLGTDFYTIRTHDLRVHLGIYPILDLVVPPVNEIVAE